MLDGDEHATDALSVALCIPTFRRPDDLARLLAALPEVIETARSEVAIGEVAVIVVDNDSAASAEQTVRAAGVPAHYVVESERGVVAVRNRALDEAAGHDIVVFIDDDETPADARWLSRLLATRVEHDATVVAGPVRTVTDEPLDPWIVAGGFFDRTHRAGLRTGAPITRAATNNLLLDRRFVAESGIRFDARFGRTGGEDSLFTSQLHAAGAHMVWCAEALVLDHLPVERRTRAHALERTRGMANAGARVALALAASRSERIVVRMKAIVSGVVRWAVGGVRGAVGALTRSERLRATGARERARGRGSISGAGNRTRDLYGGGGVR
ncbi:glycosyltransferase family 2 protein [Microbacterium sp. 3J1]|uniref:glycosyltransferase family 2 protein n=1 Tax=Microbacterium sp. 3J1 TaxID=861269 RepID=UPI000A5EB7BE|nr:glycosyltransferase [Microbacterium sp. 3J1]